MLIEMANSASFRYALKPDRATVAITTADYNARIISHVHQASPQAYGNDDYHGIPITTPGKKPVSIAPSRKSPVPVYKAAYPSPAAVCSAIQRAGGYKALLSA